MGIQTRRAYCERSEQEFSAVTTVLVSHKSPHGMWLESPLSWSWGRGRLLEGDCLRAIVESPLMQEGEQEEEVALGRLESRIFVPACLTSASDPHWVPQL